MNLEASLAKLILGENVANDATFYLNNFISHKTGKIFSHFFGPTSVKFSERIDNIIGHRINELEVADIELLPLEGLLEKVTLELKEEIEKNNDFLIKHISNLLVWISNAIKKFDEATGKHVNNVGKMALLEIERIIIEGKKEVFFDNELLVLGNDDLIKYSYVVACIFHDIGKLGIRTNILNKPSPFDPNEYDVMKKHTSFAEEILSLSNEIGGGNEINEIISNAIVALGREHHEKINGKGYPLGLNGDEISKIAQLITIIDIFEGASSQRIYQDESTIKGMFIKGCKVLLIFNGPGLNQEFLSFFMSKFGIIDIYKYSEENFEKEIREDLDFENNPYILRELDRIKSSEITSKKTIQEAEDSKTLIKAGILKSDYMGVVELTHLFENLGYDKNSIRILFKLGINGKVIKKLFDLSKMIGNQDEFGNELVEILEQTLLGN